MRDLFFAHPLVLWLLPLAAVLPGWAWRAAPRRRAAVALLRAGAVACLILAAAKPLWLSRRAAPVRVGGRRLLAHGPRLGDPGRGPDAVRCRPSARRLRQPLHPPGHHRRDCPTRSAWPPSVGNSTCRSGPTTRPTAAPTSPTPCASPAASSPGVTPGRSTCTPTACPRTATPPPKPSASPAAASPFTSHPGQCNHPGRRPRRCCAACPFPPPDGSARACPRCSRSNRPPRNASTSPCAAARPPRPAATSICDPA